MLYSLAYRLSGLVEAFAAEVALSWVAGLTRPATALNVSDPRVPVPIRARALERAEQIRALAQRVAVIQFWTAALVEICITRKRNTTDIISTCYTIICVC